jgi:hypothetical protein
MNRYYENGGICEPCFYNCETCINGTNCLTCNLATDFRVIGTPGVCVCEDGTIFWLNFKLFKIKKFFFFLF